MCSYKHVLNSRRPLSKSIIKISKQTKKIKNNLNTTLSHKTQSKLSLKTFETGTFEIIDTIFNDPNENVRDKNNVTEVWLVEIIVHSGPLNKASMLSVYVVSDSLIAHNGASAMIWYITNNNNNGNNN